MVSGHLQVKKGYYYVVLSYNDNNGKRRVKYFSTGLSEKGNKRKAEAELLRIRGEFEPPNEVGELAADMLFADYLLQWLDIIIQMLKQFVILLVLDFYMVALSIWKVLYML